MQTQDERRDCNRVNLFALPPPEIEAELEQAYRSR
jgi:hypothetical protein